MEKWVSFVFFAENIVKNIHCSRINNDRWGKEKQQFAPTIRKLYLYIDFQLTGFPRKNWPHLELKPISIVLTLLNVSKITSVSVDAFRGIKEGSVQDNSNRSRAAHIIALIFSIDLWTLVWAPSRLMIVLTPIFKRSKSLMTKAYSFSSTINCDIIEMEAPLNQVQFAYWTLMDFSLQISFVIDSFDWINIY